MPVWNLGLVPSPVNEEEFREFGRKAWLYCEECDRIKNDDRKRSIGTLLQFLGTDDHEEALARFAERYGIPAFLEPEKRGAKPGKKFIRQIKLLAAIEEIKRPKPDMGDVEALQLYDQELKKSKARNKLTKLRQDLSEARAIYRQIRL